MKVDEQFVILCGQVGNFTKDLTGTSVVDAYFGPSELAPHKQNNLRTAEDILSELQELKDSVGEDISNPLRKEYLLGEIGSLSTVVRWLSGAEISYTDLVHELFHIWPKKFPESEIDKTIEELGVLLQDFPGDGLREKVSLFTKDGEVKGSELRDLIEGELQQKSNEICGLFEERIYSRIGVSVTDNGVQYGAVSDRPWSGYNYYQGGFRSQNQFNIDRQFNRDSLLRVLYHEYEHHVSNLWREKTFIERGYTDLSIIPLHTGRCVISEGTADTAKDFLGVKEKDIRDKIGDALYRLRRMVSINSALKMNHEGESEEDAVYYLSERGLRDFQRSKSSIPFIRPKQEDGRPNFWAPYVFTYYIGRTDFVLPTFQKAKENNTLDEFFKTVYLHPYSLSSVTWDLAFEWL